MITKKSTLADVCFEVSAALEAMGIAAVLTGGSAAAMYAPNAYMSDDADFILEDDDPLADVSVALEPTGFFRVTRSRIFSHAETRYTVDFPKGPLAVGGEYIDDTHVLTWGDRKLRIITATDSIRDRLAHFYHWNDYTALHAAVGVALRKADDVDYALLRAWSERESPDFLEKLAEFERRVRDSQGVEKL